MRAKTSLELSGYFLDEKEMNKVGDDDWSQYYCNECLAERMEYFQGPTVNEFWCANIMA